MFFIGGFNTALPYVLYLAFVWVFVIIGLSGKHINLSPEKHSFLFKNSELSLALCNFDTSGDNDDNNPAGVVSFIRKIPEHPPNKGISTCHPIDLVIPGHTGLQNFRGPPV